MSHSQPSKIQELYTIIIMNIRLTRWMILRHNQTYNTKLVIDIEPSIGTIQPLVIELNGSGTYDQKAEAVLDI